jgi:hypothetical protein
MISISNLLFSPLFALCVIVSVCFLRQYTSFQADRVNLATTNLFSKVRQYLRHWVVAFIFEPLYRMCYLLQLFEGSADWIFYSTEKYAIPVLQVVIKFRDRYKIQPPVRPPFKCVLTNNKKVCQYTKPTFTPSMLREPSDIFSKCRPVFAYIVAQTPVILFIIHSVDSLHNSLPYTAFAFIIVFLAWKPIINALSWVKHLLLLTSLLASKHMASALAIAITVYGCPSYITYSSLAILALNHILRIHSKLLKIFARQAALAVYVMAIQSGAVGTTLAILVSRTLVADSHLLVVLAILAIASHAVWEFFVGYKPWFLHGLLATGSYAPSFSQWVLAFIGLSAYVGAIFTDCYASCTTMSYGMLAIYFVAGFSAFGTSLRALDFDGDGFEVPFPLAAGSSSSSPSSEDSFSSFDTYIGDEVRLSSWLASVTILEEEALALGAVAAVVVAAFFVAAVFVAAVFVVVVAAVFVAAVLAAVVFVAVEGLGVEYFGLGVMDAGFEVLRRIVVRAGGWEAEDTG